MLIFKDHLQIASSLLFNLKTLLASPYWSEEKMQAYQLKHLKARLTDAKNKVTHYKDLPHPEEIQSLTDWGKIPVLTKQHLLSQPIEDRINHDFSFKNLIEAKSSGSTGMPLAIQVVYVPLLIK